MAHSLLNWRWIGLACLILLGFTLWSQRSAQRPAPLRAELAAIVCPPEQAEHAVGVFAKTRILFLCVDKKQASQPALLRCQQLSDVTHPMTCEDSGSFHLSRSSAGQVFGSSIYHVKKRKGGNTDATEGDTEIIFDFSAIAPEETAGVLETAREFALPDGGDFAPPGFTYVKSRKCDKSSTPLMMGSCGFEMKSESLYWKVTVNIIKPKGTPITAEEYRQELAFFMKYLPMLVTEPGPAK